MINAIFSKKLLSTYYNMKSKLNLKDILKKYYEIYFVIYTGY